MARESLQQFTSGINTSFTSSNNLLQNKKQNLNRGYTRNKNGLFGANNGAKLL